MIVASEEENSPGKQKIPASGKAGASRKQAEEVCAVRPSCGPLSFFSVHGVARAHGPNGPGDQGIQIPTQHGGSARDDIPRAAGRKLFILVLLFTDFTSMSWTLLEGRISAPAP